MNEILARIDEKKKKLDAFRPLPKALEKNLGDWYRIALTYTSNAIEGNTLSHAETALVVQDGITVGGKSLVEHLEALNHAQAITYTQKLAATKKRDVLTLDDVLSIHRCILQKIDDTHAGVLRSVAVRITGSQVSSFVIPDLIRDPSSSSSSQLMDEFMSWLITSTDHVAHIAAEAHLKFVFIHPFIDGNGRTARLLFNLLLLQEGYPLIIIEKEKRLDYINSIEKALLHHQTRDYYTLMFQAIEHSLDSYLSAIAQSDTGGQ